MESHKLEYGISVPWIHVKHPVKERELYYTKLKLENYYHRTLIVRVDDHILVNFDHIFKILEHYRANPICGPLGEVHSFDNNFKEEIRKGPQENRREIKEK